MFIKAFWITVFLSLCLLATAGDIVYQAVTVVPEDTLKTGAALFVGVWLLVFAGGLASTGLSDALDAIIKRVFVSSRDPRPSSRKQP